MSTPGASGNLEASIREGEQLFADGKLQEAHDHFVALTQTHPDSAMVWNDLGAVLYAAGHEFEAREAFDQAVARAPGDPDILLNLAELHIEAGRIEAGLPHLRTFHDVHPTRPEGVDLLHWLGIRADDRTRVLLLDTDRQLGRARKGFIQALKEGGLRTRDVQPKVLAALESVTGRSRAEILADIGRATRPFVVFADETSADEARIVSEQTGARVVMIERLLDEEGKLLEDISHITDELGEIPPATPSGDPVKPVLSVVVASDGDPQQTRNLLDRLALQDLEPSLFEVVVAFTGREDRLSGTLRAERWPFHCTRIHVDEGGLDSARDVALMRARGDLVVFFESTALPAADNLRRHLVAHHEAAQPAIIQGTMKFATDGALETAIQKAGLLRGYLPSAPAQDVDFIFLSSDNLSVARADLEAAGGFARDVRPEGHGDLALWHHLISQHGYQGQRVPVIQAKSALQITLPRFVEYHARMGHAKTLLAEQSEELCQELFRHERADSRWVALEQRRILDESRVTLGDRTEESIVQLIQTIDALPSDSTERLARLDELDGVLRALSARTGATQVASVVGDATITDEADEGLFDRKTSVIMLNLNGEPHLRDAVNSLREHTTGPYELIVVDNGSTDGSDAWLAAQDDVQLVRMEENVGAPAARNVGLEVATGDTILFCDNDVVFTPGWRELLVGHMARHPDIGIIGPMSDVVAGHQKTQRLPSPNQELDAFARSFTSEFEGQHRYTHRLILFFMLVRREVVDTIGGIDTRYGRWGFEDDDFSIRALQAGYQLCIAKDCFVRHLGSQTAKSAALDYEALLLQNWEVFKTRFGIEQDLAYGEPYDVDAIISQSFDPDAHRIPLGLPRSGESASSAAAP